MTNMLTSMSDIETVEEQEVDVPAERLVATELRRIVLGRSVLGRSVLGRTVRDAVIPRLKSALAATMDQPQHPLIAGAVATVGQPSSHAPIAHGEIAGLAAQMLADDRGGAHRRIDMLRHQGCSLETIFVELLAPTACHLRAMWGDDICGLGEMALAFSTLQALLRHYAAEFRAEGDRPDTGLRALLASPAHRGIDVDLPVFGLMLTSEFFRRAGWDAWIERDLTSRLFRETVRGWFDLVEVLATSDAQLDEIAAGIKAIRRDSANPAVGVIVCGQVFVDHPELVAMVGADMMATDPVSSLAQAESLVQVRLADQRRALERARSLGQMLSLEKILVQAGKSFAGKSSAGEPSAGNSSHGQSSPQTCRAPAEESAQVMSLVQAHTIPTFPTLRKRLS